MNLRKLSHREESFVLEELDGLRQSSLFRKLLDEGADLLVAAGNQSRFVLRFELRLLNSSERTETALECLLTGQAVMADIALA